MKIKYMFFASLGLVMPLTYGVDEDPISSNEVMDKSVEDKALDSATMELSQPTAENIPPLDDIIVRNLAEEENDNTSFLNTFLILDPARPE